MADLREAFDRTAKANNELIDDLDAALIESGRALADRVDEGLLSGDGQALYLVPHLMNILREMYATPKSRLDAGIGKEAARGKLAEVRDLRNRPSPTKKRATGA